MVIARIIGGLGNQMFQYAAARNLSLQKKEPLYLDISAYASHMPHQGFELFRIFGCDGLVIGDSDIERSFGWRMHPYFRRLTLHPRLRFLRTEKIIHEPGVFFRNALLDAEADVYLSGYWQSEKYFLPICDQIRSDFSFKLALNEKNQELVEEIEKCNAVSLHIRRGDYVSNKNAHKVHGVLSIAYYRAAVEHIFRFVQNPEFFLFSDDPDWCAHNFRIAAPCHFVTHNSGAESFNDMRLMSICKHNIIANSSFSWWGAWLNPSLKKIVIAPHRWFANEMKASDIIPANWLRM